VGDVHQPLHAVSLYTKELTAAHLAKSEPDTGDRGGNLVFVIPADGEKVNLHAYWDGLFGGYSTVYGAIVDTFGHEDEDRLRGAPSAYPRIMAPGSS